jgi:two-component system response regulator YesN
MNQRIKGLLKRFKNKRLFTQLFTVMAAFSAILMVVVSIVVSHQTTATFINNNNLIYSNTLKVSIQTLDTLFSGFHNSLTHITYDASVVDSVVTPKPLDSVANYQVWSVLNGYCQETEAIEEVYLYVKETDQVLTSSYEKSSLDFFRKRDLMARHFLNKPGTTLLKSGRATAIEVYDQGIYMVRDFPLNGDKRLGTLFMKMKPSILYESLAGAQTSFSNLLAYDSDWNPLFPSMLDYSLLPKEAIKDIPLFMSQGKNTLYLNNQHYFFCKSEDTGINMVLLVDDFAFMPSAKVILINSLPYFALILVCSSLLSVCVLYLTYMPVQKLKNMISTGEIKEERKALENEWDYLTESFLKISNHKYQLDYILSNMIPKISREFYLDLLSGKHMELSYIQSILTNINSPLTESGVCKTMAITFKESIEPALKTQVLETLSDTLAKESTNICHYVLQQIDDSLYALILQFLPERTSGEITVFEIHLEQAVFKELTDLDGTWLVFGPKCTSLQNISFSYQETLERLAAQKYPSVDQKTDSSLSAEDYLTPDYHFFQMQLKSITDLVMKGDCNLALQRAAQICQLISREEDPEDMWKAYEFFRLSFLNTLSAYRITEAEQGEYPLVFSTPPCLFQDMQDISDAKDYIVSFCTDAIHLLSEKYQKQQHKYLIRAKHYIEENYNNPDLSLNLLAEQCKTTTSYLSRLFKDSFGINFVDYLNQYRIHEAKELLLQGTRPVKEIASVTGFNSQQNFIRVFKKHTGVTPGQFKK